MKNSCFRFSFAWAALTILGALSAAAAERQPNFLVILADNVGKEWFGCYGADEKHTPNIDRLAAEGVQFNTFWVTPLCSTTRVSLLTGRYGFTTGWHTHHDASFYGGGGLDWRKETTFARELRKAGYATAIGGKWQLNDLYNERDALKLLGFDEHLIWTGALEGTGHAEERYAAFDGRRMVPESRYWDPVVFDNGERKVLKGEFGPDVTGNFVIDFMRRNRDRPFVIYYPSILTHNPPVPTPLNPDPDASPRELFAGMVRHLDHQVGMFVEELEQLGLRGDTIILFMTDDGSLGQMSSTINGKLWRGNRGLMEPDLDVPFIVNCPARIPGGRVSDALTDCTDLFPTLLDMAGLKIPEGMTDGHSLAPLLTGSGNLRGPRDWIFSMYHTERVVRDHRFKLYSAGNMFDVALDPLETNDLADSTDLAVIAARQRLSAVLKSLPPSANLGFAFRSGSARQIQADGAWNRRPGR